MDNVIKKLKFKDKGVVMNAPAEMDAAFTNAGFVNAFNKNDKSGNTLFFVNNKSELLNDLTHQLTHVERDSVLWFAYPKGTSKIKTDIHRDIIRETAEAFGITTVAAISINDTWSALRFRPIDKIGIK